MPELPEVQTTVDGINDVVKGLTITDVWTDYNSLFHAGKDNIKNPEYFSQFKKDVVGSKIKNASRVGKNVLIHLSNKKTILTHMKMTGHYMYGKYVYRDKIWQPEAQDGPLRDPFNRHIHLVFSLSDGKHLAFSDLRKFAKVFIFDTENEKTIEDLMGIGPDPLDSSFSYEVFKSQLLKRPTWKIKLALMSQELIAGIGNIYSDEMLWESDIHPESHVGKIPEKNFKKMFSVTTPLLQRGIDFGGDSDSDYRNIHGESGNFQNKHHAYRRTGEACDKKGCNGTIARLKMGGRSAHFCDIHQVRFT
ncbi:MAG: bifunctional DNA-formamidopyrimidine glycosylase/DNA-(apurinic or apyrimidinic site) lyase [Patescibacteria group bacterium]